MTYTLKLNGDLLERKAASFIQTHLNNYEILWAIFIGNDGTNTIAKMPSISNELQINRKLFSQHHYTVLESLYFMHLIAEDEKNSSGVSSFNDYRKTMNNLIAFFAYTGRLRDNIEKCFSILGEGNKQNKAMDKLNEFYYQRHIIIHGTKIPYRIDELTLFQIPQLRREKSSNAGFDQSEIWNNLSAEAYVFLSEEMSILVTELCPKVNSLIGDMLGLVKRIITSSNLSLAEPIYYYDNDGNQYGFPDFSNNITTSGSEWT